MKNSSSSQSQHAENFQQLNVFLNNVAVGSLICIPPDRTIFTLSEEYIKNPARPTLTFNLKNRERDELKELVWKSNVILPPFFSNLLPEGPLRKYLADLNRVNAKREFFLLQAVGGDLPGAVRAVPSDTIRHFPEHFAAEETQDATQENTPQRLRFSLGGVQLKFSALQDFAGGLTIPVDGMGGSWIVKLASTQLPDVPQNEYSMLQLASLMDIEVPEARLVKTASVENLPQPLPDRFDLCLAIKRFDRTDSGTRIHIEDFAQVFDVCPDDKYTRDISYAHLAAFIWKFIGEDALKQFIRRIVFNLAICNTDMHLKNWSLIYRDSINPQLSPAYDLVATHYYVGHRELSLKLGNTREMTAVNRETFRKLIITAKLPEHIVLETVNDSVSTFRKVWSEHKNDLPIPAFVRSSIDEHLDKVPLFWKI